MVSTYRGYEVALTSGRGPSRRTRIRGRLRRFGQEQGRAGRVEAARGEGVRVGRVRRLPHAQGREREGPGRTEPGRAEARRLDRRAPGAARWQRDAVLREPPLVHADLAG